MRKMKRIKRWTGVLLAGFIGAGVCFSGTAVTGVVQEVTAYADTVPEVEVSTDKTTAKPGDKVRFVMDVKKNSDIVNRFSDEHWGSVSLIIRNIQTGSTKTVELSKKTDNTYEGEIEITSDWWYNGKYTATDIYGIKSTVVFNKNINLTINSAEEAPAVKKVTFDKNKVVSGEEVEVSIAPSDIEDIDLKDVEDCNLSVSVGKGKYYWSITLVPDNDGKFKGVFEVNDRWLTGDYKIKEITVGHTLAKMPNPESTVFSVTESGEDQKSPVVKAINLDKKAAVPGGVIKITADAEDASGTGEISLSISHESEWYGYAQLVMLKPDEKGVPTGYLFINDNWKNGKYTVKVHRVKDKLGNYVSDDYDRYYYDESYGYGYVQNQTFTVSGSKEESPREDNNSKGHIEKKEVMIGEEISIVLESDEPTSEASFRFNKNTGGYCFYVDIYRRSDGKFEGKVQIKNDYQQGIVFNEGDEWIGEGMQLPSGREIIIPYYENGQPLSFKIIGTKKVVKNISLDKTLLVLDKGKTGKLTATVTPADADDKTVTWSSSNTNVATVDASGNVKAINHGIAKITAKTSNGKTAESEVRVNFIDVTNAKEWYYKPVYWAAEKGITTGTDGKFFHADNCTREQAITFLWRMAGKPDPKNMTSKFVDVKDSKRYSYKAIMWGNENGIITGTDGKFYPTGTCTREQIVTMIWRLAGKPEPKNMNSRFKDVTSKTRYSYKAVMWAQENGITTGTNGLFFPTGLCKRREIVTFIYRYKN